MGFNSGFKGLKLALLADTKCYYMFRLKLATIKTITGFENNQLDAQSFFMYV